MHIQEFGDHNSDFEVSNLSKHRNIKIYKRAVVVAEQVKPGLVVHVSIIEC